MVAAGSVVTEGMQVPARHLVAGAPAVVKKELSGRSLEWVGMAAPEYQELAATYRAAGLDNQESGLT
jgi:carbonic anhydrase/acetyltransferase-like protein (isoleucine patch superfamily)